MKMFASDAKMLKVNIERYNEFQFHYFYLTLALEMQTYI